MDKAKEALKEGEILQVNGIVDCSEHGWAVVEEYDKHELAENYNDKKRLYRAELHAGRKIKAAAAKNKKKKMAIGRTGDQDSVRSSWGYKFQWSFYVFAVFLHLNPCC